MDNAVQQSLGAQFGALAGAMRGFLQPHLTRYAYWNGWERVEDVERPDRDDPQVRRRPSDPPRPGPQDVHRLHPGHEPTDAPAAAGRRRAAGAPAPAEPAAAGTANATLTAATRALGTQRIENMPAAGYDTTMTFAMSNATGSCRNGNASVETVQYLAALPQPAVRLPGAPARAAPETRRGDGRAAQRRLPADLRGQPQRPDPARQPARALQPLPDLRRRRRDPRRRRPAAARAASRFLTERGNLTPWAPPTPGLFGVPPGFTKSP